jgi:hypothetical protein
MQNMLSSETVNVVVCVVLGLHVVIELAHYAFGFVDHRRTKRMLADMKTLLERVPPCLEILRRIEKKVGGGKNRRKI